MTGRSTLNVQFQLDDPRQIQYILSTPETQGHQTSFEEVDK